MDVLNAPKKLSPRARRRHSLSNCLHGPFKRHLKIPEGRSQDGRVFLAGDAAHLNWPAGTQIGNAVDIGWKLAAALRG